MKYSLLGACAIAVCCTAPAFAQGLTRVETIGLQQQLRDDGCGVTHVTGRMDATTRAAVKKCQSKYSGATDAKSMLAAMDIGFGNGTPDPTLKMARSGATGGSMSAGGISGSSTTTDTTAGKVDLNKATPMTPTHAATNPVPSQGSTNPMALPKHDTTTTPVDTASGIAPTKPPLDTTHKRDTIPARDTTLTMPRRDTMPTMPRRDTMPKRDTMPNSTSTRI